jgi:hypothetical protein
VKQYDMSKYGGHALQMDEHGNLVTDWTESGEREVVAQVKTPAIEVCPRCGARGPWRFVKYNERGAIVECVNVVKGAVGFCGRRVQVDL